MKRRGGGASSSCGGGVCAGVSLAVGPTSPDGAALMALYRAFSTVVWRCTPHTAHCAPSRGTKPPPSPPPPPFSACPTKRTEQGQNPTAKRGPAHRTHTNRPCTSTPIWLSARRLKCRPSPRVAIYLLLLLLLSMCGFPTNPSQERRARCQSRSSCARTCVLSTAAIVAGAAH